MDPEFVSQLCLKGLYCNGSILQDLYWFLAYSLGKLQTMINHMVPGTHSPPEDGGQSFDVILVTLMWGRVFSGWYLSGLDSSEVQLALLHQG